MTRAGDNLFRRDPPPSRVWAWLAAALVGGATIVSVGIAVASALG